MCRFFVLSVNKADIEFIESRCGEAGSRYVITAKSPDVVATYVNIGVVAPRRRCRHFSVERPSASVAMRC